MSAAARLAANEPGSAEERRELASLLALPPKCPRHEASSPRVPDVIAQRIRNGFVITTKMLPLPPAVETAMAGHIVRNDAPTNADILSCIVTLRPEPAKALIRTNVGSPRERAAISRLSTETSGCVPQGMQVRWTPLDYRLGIARALYRRGGLLELIDQGFRPNR